MNRYNKALTANQTAAHALDVNQHAPQHIRLAWIENFLYDRKKINRYKGWTTLPMLVKAMNQTTANVLRLVRILENQGRVEVELDGRDGDGNGYQCLWIRPLKSSQRQTFSV